MFYNNKITLCALAISTIFAGQSIAAQRVDLAQPISLADNKIDVQQLFSTQKSIKNDSAYLAATNSFARNGDQRSRYQQYYKGVPIYGASVVASVSTKGTFYDLNGEHIADIAADLPSTETHIDLDTAIDLALNAGENSFRQAQIYNLESKLYVWLDDKNIAHLAWLISYVTKTDTPSRPYTFIDANNGKILDSWNGLTFAHGTGPGGNQRTGRYEYGPGKTYPAFTVTENGSSCRLDSTNVVTYDMNHQTSGGNVHSFSCYENSQREVNGSYSALNDAHAFGIVTFDMYRDWFNQAPLTQKLKLRVHYDRDYENAFWDGQQMTFGDGKNTFHPLVGLGVVAHEVSHGFTQQNSNLAYRNQSGGLNESFSDIAAAAASYYLTGTFSWQIGDKIKKNSGAMRYMDNPPLDGRSIDHTNSYSDGINVHFSSGIFNKAFYLLSTTQGWDIKKAFEIYVKANQLYWTANSSFNQAGAGVYNAAKDLNYCVDDVINSLEAVGVTNAGAKNGSGCDPIGNQPPVANFSHSKNKLAVSFTDNSTDDGGVVSHLWNFGDNMTSTEKNPSHVYASKGTYSVSLVVKDAESLEDTKTTSITVTDGGGGGGGSCDGIANWSVTTNYTLDEVVAYQGEKYVAIWWSTGAAPNIFTNVWSHQGSCGQTGENQPPIAGFNFSVDNLTVSFSDTSSDDKAVTSYMWNFGDGTSATEKSPVHNYTAEGTYTVQLTVADQENLTNTISKSVTVTQGGNGTCNAPAWSSSTVYLSGDTVSQSGNEYRANWWNQNDSPEQNSGPWQVWTLVGSCK